MRLIPYEIVPTSTRSACPRRSRTFADCPRGLVLVTGPTGLGQVDDARVADRHRQPRAPCHIMTVEDPIEFLHKHKRCIVNQREVGEDTHSFAEALKHVLRQDPDVILVGEMRDLETISTALDRGRDRSPRVRDAAHPGRAAVDRPHHRRVPAAPAAAGPGAARRVAAGHLHAAAPADAPTGTAARCRARCWSPRRRSATSSVRARSTRSTRCMQAGGRYGMARWTCRSPSSCAGRVTAARVRALPRPRDAAGATKSDLRAGSCGRAAAA